LYSQSLGSTATGPVGSHTGPRSATRSGRWSIPLRQDVLMKMSKGKIARQTTAKKKKKSKKQNGKKQQNKQMAQLLTQLRE
jgi:hypothetical protein